MSYRGGWLRVMGVLYDYFRATDDDAAVALMEATEGGGPAVTAREDPRLDAIDLKGIDPTVILGQLVGFARGVGWKGGPARQELLWSGPEEDGPWLVSIDDATRDTLASITGEQMPGLSAQWGRIEEVRVNDPLPDDAMLPVLNDIVGLAQRARRAGEHLYCWCCL
jgi:hypothetical protein